MLATVAAACALAGASALVGAAITRLCGHDPWSGFAPAVGLAALIAIAAAAIKLPGESDAAAIALVLATGAAAAVLLALAGERPRLDAALPIALGGTLLLSLVPFIVAGDFGLLGIGINNDTSSHLAWAEALASDIPDPLPLPPGYPLADHSLVAAFADLTGLEMDRALMALMIAVPLLTAPAALRALEGAPAVRRGLAAIPIAFGYLLASYYAEGAFKETIAALFVLAFVLVLRELSRARAHALGGAVLLGVLAAGAVLNYSYFGAGWMVATLALWALAELATDAGSLSPRALWAAARARMPRGRRAWIAVAAGVLALAVPVAPQLGRTADFLDEVSLSPSQSGTIGSSVLGNLVQEVPPWEALGVWPREDFRYYPDDTREAYKLGLIGALALLALAWGALWLLRRRELALLSGAVVAGGVWLYLKLGESPYVAAKALVIAAPLAAVVILRPLLAARGRAGGPWDQPLLRGAVAAAFVGVGIWSSYTALKGAQVWPPEHRGALESIRGEVSGKKVLFLGNDEFAFWQLRGAVVTDVFYNQRLTPVGPRPQKREARVEGPNEFGKLYDFDTPDSPQLDPFDYVVTVASRYASEPPGNFRLVRRTPYFWLWQRTATTQRRYTLDEGTSPGRVLDCSTRAGRALSRRPGSARVRPAPVAVGGRRSSYRRPGMTAVRRLRLGPGRWELGLQYNSSVDVEVDAGGRRFELPATLDRPGPVWTIGAVDSPGGVTRVALTPRSPASIESSTRGFSFGALVAVRTDAPPRTVPLRQACGQYVDWFTVDA